MEQKTALKSIRAKCLDCCNDSSNEVKLCKCETCHLYPYRFGKNPYVKKREYTEEQKKEMADRLKKARELKSKK